MEGKKKTKRKNHENKKAKKTGNGKHSQHVVQMDPKIDLAEIKYEDICDVNVIKPIVFEEDGTIKDGGNIKDNGGKHKRGDPEKVINTQGNKDKEKIKGKDKIKDKIKDKVKDEEKAKDFVKPVGKPEQVDLRDATLIQMSLGGKKGHPWESRIEGQLCMVANRIPGGILTLERGKKYVIRYIGKDGSGYEMILTRDPAGGSKAALLDGTTSVPASQDRLLILNKECPNTLYYQDRNKEFLGGQINVIK